MLRRQHGPGGVVDARFGLGHVIVVGHGVVGLRAELAVGGDGGEDQAGVGLFQILVTQTPGVHGPQGESLQQHVGLGGQALQDLAPLRLVQVQGDVIFVAAFYQVVEALSLVHQAIGGAGAQKVALGRLHPYHLGPELREHGGAIGPGVALAAQVQHHQAFQGF